MPFRVVADTDRAEMLVEHIFLRQYSPLQTHLAHNNGYRGEGGLVPKKPDRDDSARTRVSSEYKMVGHLSFPDISVLKSKNLTPCLND